MYNDQDINDAIVDALQHGADTTASRIVARFPDKHDCDMFMMAVLMDVMHKPPQMVEAVARLDNAVRVLTGEQPIDDPLLTLWSGR